MLCCVCFFLRFPLFLSYCCKCITPTYLVCVSECYMREIERKTCQKPNTHRTYVQWYTTKATNKCFSIFFARVYTVSMNECVSFVRQYKFQIIALLSHIYMDKINQRKFDLPMQAFTVSF